MTDRRPIVIHLPSRKATYLPVGLVLGVVLAFGLNSMAENTELDSDNRVFPYNGVLELDGAGYTGLADFQFTLTDDESCNYSEDHDAVGVSGGRFSVNIGGIDPDANGLPGCVFDAERMFIQIAVREANDEAPHRALTGRQRINPVPYAYWAAEGSDFRVDGNVNATGDGNFGGTANIGGNAIVDGNIRVDGTISDPSGGVTIDDGLTVTGNQNLEGELRNDDGNVTINDSLTVTGTSNLRGNIVDSAGDVVVDDGFVVTGRTRLRGNVEDDQGDLVLNDNVDINGLLDLNGNLDLTGNIFDSGGTVGIDDDVSVTGTLTADRLSTREVATSGNDGCLRIENVQICWGQIGSNHSSESFVKDFGNSNISIVANPVNGTVERMAVPKSITAGSFDPNLQNGSGSDRNDTAVRYVAFGAAGDEW